MEAIILAGGFGTRLSHIVPDVPKPMAQVNGEPFLKYIFEYLLKNGVSHVVLAVGYKHESIENYFGKDYKGIKITYSIEDSPLGTGGAIKKAISRCEEEDVFVLNGDSYFGIDLDKLKEFHQIHGSKLTIAVKALSNFARYGSVVIEDHVIKEFVEKKPAAYGRINAGTYLMKRDLFHSIDEEAFSFEKRILESGLVSIYAYESTAYFIDIGVPEDYYKAQADYSQLDELDGKVNE